MKIEVQHTQLKAVTLFEDRAEVRRQLRLPLTAGRHTLQISGLSAVMDDPSLLCGARPGQVLSARVLREIQTQGSSAEEINTRQQALFAATDALHALSAQIERLNARQMREMAVFNQWIEGVACVPEDIASWEAAWKSQKDRLSTIIAELATARVAQAKALQIQILAQAQFKATEQKQQRFHTFVEVQLEVLSDATVEIELRYLLPCALWRPAHLARLDGQKLLLETFAVAWNASGEDWAEVPIAFSTARPGRPAEPPLLQDDILVLRNKTAEEQRQVIVQAREVDIKSTGSEGRRQLEEMPGVEDGGEPLTFTTSVPSHLPSHGEAVWFAVEQRQMTVLVERAAWPERSEVVHLKVSGTVAGPHPILSGPVRLFRQSEAIGVGRIDFVAAGDGFSLGFGPDDALRLRRRFSDKRDTSLMGTQKIEREVRLYLSNTSAQPQRFKLYERVPVSELSEITLEVIQDGGGRLETDGRLNFEISLEALEQKELTYTWRLEAKSSVRLPF